MGEEAEGTREKLCREHASKTATTATKQNKKKSETHIQSFRYRTHFKKKRINRDQTLKKKMLSNITPTL